VAVESQLPAPVTSNGKNARCKACCTNAEAADAAKTQYQTLEGKPASCHSGVTPNPDAPDFQAASDEGCKKFCQFPEARPVPETQDGPVAGKTVTPNDAEAQAQTPATAATGGGNKPAGGANKPAEVPTAESDEELKSQVAEMVPPSKAARAGKIVAKALKWGAKMTSNLVQAALSTKLSWAFTQAISQDDEISSDGSQDFLRHGVTVSALAGFFYTAIAGCTGPGTFQNLMTGGGLANSKTGTAGFQGFKVNEEIVLQGSGTFTLKKRTCTSEEEAAKERRCNSPKAGRFYLLSECGSDQCEVGIPVLQPATQISFQLWGRVECALAVPPVKIYPTFGVEVEFDLTPLLYAGVNAKRTINHEQRVRRCEKCVASNMGFCDRKWKVTDYHPADDVCQEVLTENRVTCQSSGTPGGTADNETPRWIVDLDGCREMTYPKQTEQSQQQFVGNTLRVGDQPNGNQ
jgi:hypothetical protein